MSLTSLTLSIYSSPLCPFCLLGWRKIQRAIAASPGVDFKIKFHPFLLDPTLPETPISKKARYAEKFGAERFAAMETQMMMRGREVDVNFSYDGMVRQPTDALRLLDYAYKTGGQALQLALIEPLFKGYFENEKDPGDLDFLVESCLSAGVFPSAEAATTWIQGDELRAELKQGYAAANQLGISGVPFTVINDTYAISGAQESDTFSDVFQKVASGKIPA